VKTTLVVATGALLGVLVTWLSTRFIDKQAYGFTKNLATQAIAYAVLLQFGLSNTLYIYVHTYAADAQRKKLIITISVLFPLALTGLATIVYWFFHDRIINSLLPADRPLMQQFFSWLPLYTALLALTTLFEAYLGSQMKVAASAFMREVVLRLANVALILLFAFGFISFHSFVAGSILVYFIPLIIFLFLCYRTANFGFTLDFSLFSKQVYKQLFDFSLFHFLFIGAVNLMNYLDVLAIALYDKSGYVNIAGYSVAVFLISFLQMPYKALVSASAPMMVKAYDEGRLDNARNVFSRSSINILIPTLGLMTLLVCNLHNAVAVIGTGKNYSELTSIFLILMLGRLVDIATGMNDSVLSVAKYYRFNFVASFISVVLLFVLLRLFIPRYSVAGAAWATTISITVFNIIKMAFVQRKLRMYAFSSRSLLVVVAVLPALVIGYLFPSLFARMHNVIYAAILDTAIRSLVIVALYAGMLLWLKPSADLEAFIASIKKDKRLF